MRDSQTDRNVYTLGAGFSADANAPLLYNFLDKSRQLLDDPASGLDDSEREEFATVFEFRRKMAQAREKVKLDLDNIEELFGLVEMQQRLGRSDSKIRNATVYLSAKTLELMISKGTTRQEIIFDPNSQVTGSREVLQSYEMDTHSGYTPPKFRLDMYDLFAMLIAGKFDPKDKRAHRRNAVISFNYDLVLDHALMRAGIPISYHLPAQHLSPPALGRPEGLPLLKLHGSTNWGVCSKCKESIFVSVEKMTSSPAIFKSLECQKC